MKPMGMCILCLLAAGLPTWAKPKPPAHCEVYFSVVQLNPSLPNAKETWLNAPQKKWYAKHGDREKLAGICYDPAKASYVIRWKETRSWVTSSYTTQVPTYDSQGRQTGTSSVEHSQSRRVWHAVGFLLRVEKDGKLARVTALNSKGFSFAGLGNRSASARLLANGLKEIAKVEKDKAQPSGASPRR